MINVENTPIDANKLLENLKATIADLQLQVAIKDCVIQELVKKLDKPKELKKLDELMKSKEGNKDEQAKV
ncbi:MAG: hypothetical protein Q4E09_05950 [Eubacteriales bacterium]|nr:hypothetical protein [Eubacteriales bacterium]